MSNFTVGMRVARTKKRYNPNEDDSHYGVVDAVSTSFPDKVFVKWDASWMNNNRGRDWNSCMEEVSASSLVPEEEAKTKEAELEKQFREVSQKAAAKVKEAALLIREANQMAVDIGLNLHDMHNAISPLISAMDVSGWNSSSWGC